MRGSLVSRSMGLESQCVSKLIMPTLPFARSAIGLAIAYEPQGEFWPMTIGTAPTSRASFTFASTAACARRMFSAVGL